MDKAKLLKAIKKHCLNCDERIQGKIRLCLNDKCDFYCYQFGGDMSRSVVEELDAKKARDTTQRLKNLDGALKLFNGKVIAVMGLPDWL